MRRLFYVYRKAMDRPIVYTQEQGRSTDFLFGMRSAMIGLAKLSSAVLGANTLAHGFACTPNSPAALNVLVGLGEIYALAPVDGTAYGVLPADTTDTILKQGIQLGTTTLSCPAPTTTGFSINYLIEAGYQDSDTTQVVLPYFNSANPAQPLNGPGGLGGSNATERQGIVVLQAKAGTAATTGTQTTPAPDSGFVGLWVVTVAFGASTITSGNIAQYPSAPFITNILQMLQTGSSIYAADTSGTANTISLALTPPVTTYTDGEPIRFKAANTNTGAVTINWGGGNISLTGANGALQGGEIVALKQYEAIYSAATGTAILIGQSAGSLQVAPATASQQAVQLGQLTSVGINPGRLLRTSVYYNNGGTLFLSVNGGAFAAAGSSTFTALAATQGVDVELIGGGGGSGGSGATTSTQITGAGGGGEGAYARGYYTSGFSGVTITCGVAGAAAVAGGNGGAGGSSSFGALLTTPGGGGSTGGTVVASTGVTLIAGGGGGGGVPTGTYYIARAGQQGAYATGSNGTLFTGQGGGFMLGAGGQGKSSGAGSAASGFGAGGGGAGAGTSTAAAVGGAGAPGAVIIREYA
jgi:hypothetical protein